MKIKNLDNIQGLLNLLSLLIINLFLLFCKISFVDILLYIIIVVGVGLSLYFRKLTVSAALLGGLMAILIYEGVGTGGVLMLAGFFIVGILATSWRLKDKHQEGIAEAQKGKRSMGQVFANGGVAAILGLSAWLQPRWEMNCTLLIAACFASATSDTVSSELGNVYGKRFYQITNFQPGRKGENGVISLEGTLLGLAGSLFIAILYGLWYDQLKLVWMVMLAGIIGNLADSVMGATLENRGFLRNNTVNFFNTMIGALAAWILIIINK